MKRVILGTAGHIDHGKSSLVKALTGIDPDRWKEEKERGITLDLGFANILYPDLVIGIIDVPGHEKLIKNMLAGVGGIDMVMLVVAADEGIMPQTKEHLSICDLLQIKSGIIALNKVDLVDEETLELAKEYIKEAVEGTFLQEAEIVPVSAKTGYNIELLKEKIRQKALTISEKSHKGLFRMPIDRVFTLKGFGTVVTGTVFSGKISVDEVVEILPSGLSSKIRGLQSHGEPQKEVFAGQRVGINLQGISKEDLKRGDVVTVPERLNLTSYIEVKLKLLKDATPLKNNAPVHFYLATTETVGRVKLLGKSELMPAEEAFAHIKLQEPIVAMAKDRFIIRRFSPLETLGGGVILDTEPSRKRKDVIMEDLETLYSGSLTDALEVKIRRKGMKGIKIKDMEGWINADLDQIKKSLDILLGARKIIKVQDYLFHSQIYESFKNSLIDLLTDFHIKNPLKEGLPKEELKSKLKLEKYPPLFLLLSKVEEISMDGNFIKLKKATQESIDPQIEKQILSEFISKGFQPPYREELAKHLNVPEKKLSDLLKILVKNGKLVRIKDNLYLTKENYEKMLALLKEFFTKKPEMTVSEFRTMLNTTRRYALDFLEHLDSHKITLRVGEVRKLLKRG